VLDYAKTLLNSPPSDWRTAPLPGLPAEEPSLAEVPEYLKDLVATVADLVPLMWNREKFPELPKEDEMVTHFVVPFFEALGWPPERIAIKWRNIDVALFKDLPRTPENCELVVEAKRLGQGLAYAVEQGKGYVDALGIQRDVMVTDGIRYHLYSCQRNFEPGEFVNLSHLKERAQSLFSRLKRP